MFGRSAETPFDARGLTRRAETARKGLEPITLHECRHTFASMLMAAGYTIKEIMVLMGHADLQTVDRYIKLLEELERKQSKS